VFLQSIVTFLFNLIKEFFYKKFKIIKNKVTKENTLNILQKELSYVELDSEKSISSNLKWEMEFKYKFYRDILERKLNRGLDIISFLKTDRRFSGVSLKLDSYSEDISKILESNLSSKEKANKITRLLLDL